MRWIVVAIVGLLFGSLESFANTVSLFNDSPYTLKAQIYSADGTLLGEFMLNPRDATQWSDNYAQFQLPEAPAFSQTPYTVNWFCPSGKAYGTCNNVSPGATVTAQGCGGAQECSKQRGY